MRYKIYWPKILLPWERNGPRIQSRDESQQDLALGSKASHSIIGELILTKIYQY